MSNIRKIFEEAARQASTDLPISWAFYPAYRARLDNWNTHAGVRNWKRGSILGNGKSPFSAGLVPLTHHRFVCDRGEPTSYQLQAQHFYRFCNFTEHLELEAVVPACIRLRFADTPFAVPPELARDAGRVVMDEAWHAECAFELRANMQTVIGVMPCRLRKPAFLHVLRIVKASLPARHQLLADLVFTSVSETLITGSLSKVPRDEQVLPEIREVLGEHAREEAFHHSIFGQAIGVMWQQLPADDRDVAGPLFAIFIAAFLRPDILSELDALESAGFAAKEAQQIVEETHGAAILSEDLWRAAMPTMRFMRQYGLLEHAATRDMVETLALLPSGAGNME